MTSINDIEQAQEDPEGEASLVAGIVRDVWREVLEIDDLPMDGNFMLLGGDSLAAVTAMDKIENLLGVTVTVAEFLADPTAAGVSEVLTLKYARRPNDAAPKAAPPGSGGAANGKPRPEESEPIQRYIEGQLLPVVGHVDGPAASCVVQLREGGHQPPVFLVHPGGGTVHCYKRLAEGLPEGIPVFGLQSPCLQYNWPIYTTVEEMSEILVDAIRKIQPAGPYRIAGWSAGGIIAFDIAQRLWKLGRQPTHLGLIDTAFNFTHIRSEVGSGKRFQNVLRNLVEFGPGDLLDRRWWLHWRKMSPQRLSKSNERARQERYDKKVDETFLKYRSKNNRLVLASRFIGLAAGHYAPGVYPGRVVLFRTEMLRAAQQRSNPWDVQWARVVEGGVDVVDVPGNHVSIMFRPQVDVLARQLGRYLAPGNAGVKNTAGVGVRSPGT